MTPAYHLPRRRAAVSARSAFLAVQVATCLLALGAASARAQTAAADPTAAKSAANEDAVQLSPFEVTADNDDSYGALNSNSITAFRTELAKMPVTADVFDQAFMKDTGMDNVEGLLQYFSAGAGIATPQPDNDAANSQYLDRNANGSLSLRGLQAPSTMLDGFFPAGGNGVTGTGITSPYNLEKIEVINGPQALLYGVSGAGGVVNETMKQARFGHAPFGEFKYQVGQYGNNQAQFDFGMSKGPLAIRVAAIKQKYQSYRLWIGGPMEGLYVQAAYRPVKNTTIRISYDNQTFDRINGAGGGIKLSTSSTSTDARNGQTLHWLIATNQLTGAANGAPSVNGTIPLNWENVDSIPGYYSGEYRHHHLYLGEINTTWNRWLSTQVAVGYRADTAEKFANSSPGYNAPDAKNNPTGTWAISLQSSAEVALFQPSRQKVARISALLDNMLFNGRVHSQSIVGADTTRTDGFLDSSYYVVADQNWNPVMANPLESNGYQIMPTQYWAVNNGPVYQALFNPRQARITFGGVNYVRADANQPDQSLVSPSNPEGLTGHGRGDYRHTADVQTGIYAANYSDFLDGRLTTLLGARTGRVYDRSMSEASSPPSILREVSTKFTAFNAGANFRVVNGLRGYAQLSSNYNPPGVASVDPYGNGMKTSHGLGEEVGLKWTNTGWKLSGSLALYRTDSKNETLSFTSTITNDINPAGLNQRYNAGNNLINVNRKTQGVQVVLTAAPGNWRFRFTAATVDSRINSTAEYKQLYNDQFYANQAGAVTFADGTPVYVNPKFNSKAPVQAFPPESAPTGYIPLTIGMMNDPTNTYYANPDPVSSQIHTTSNVFKVLQTVNQTHGAIATGVNGLPISALQIAPNPSAPPVGTILVTKPGDLVVGFPRISANFLGVYTFRDGFLKGVKMGGSASLGWKNARYYYYPAGLQNPNVGRVMYNYPTQALFMGLIGYTHRFRHFTLSTQVNVYNMFNHYHVVLLPNYITGWAGPNNATFDQQPRSYTWTTTFDF